MDLQRRGFHVTLSPQLRTCTNSPVLSVRSELISLGSGGAEETKEREGSDYKCI